MVEKDSREMMVSIRCLVYNHEPYLRQCLDGFVMQQTNFRFEAIVHDDASTDGSAAIIREYAAKYPDIIKPIYETENQYSKRDGSIRRIMNAYTHGKYIASCEGDDYWIDPLKLQKQVDFMEAHPNYSMCFARALEHYEDGSREDNLFSIVEDRDYEGIELFEQWIVPTASVLYRTEILYTKLFEEVRSSKKLIFGDTPLFLTCAHYGKLRGFSDVFCVYRRHAKGMTSTALNNHDSYKRYQYHLLEIYKLFGSIYKKKSIDFFIYGHCTVFWQTFRARGIKTRYDFLYEAMSVSIWGCFKFFCAKLKKMVMKQERALV